MEEFEVGQIVNTPYGQGEVWKISDIAVHVRHKATGINARRGDYTYMRFMFNKTHHSQTPIETLIELNK